MRALRSTLYSPALEPMTIVVRDSDITDTLESARVRTAMPGFFVATDLFEIDGEADIVVATVAATLRQEAMRDDERNMAIQFYWATAQFQLVSRTGHVIMPLPAPLSVEQVRTVFEQITQHPDYTEQSVTATTKDGVHVHIEKGEVKS